jgi:membrane peptidoglycan carboxypeptidase
MKIIIFVWALDNAPGHDLNTMTVVDGTNDPIEGAWRPQHHCGGRATLYVHTAESTNCPPVVLASWMGFSRVQQLFREQLHVNPVKHAAMVIGGAAGSEVRMIDLAELYGAIANGGLLHSPVTIGFAANGSTLLPKAEPTGNRVFSEKAAFQGLQMMTAPLQPYGTAAGAWKQMQLPPGPQYAKTGTGQVSDASYVAILGNRQLLLLAWVGMDDNEPLPMARGFQGASAAMPIVTTVIRQLNTAQPWVFAPRPLTVPAGLVPLQVSPQQGCVLESGGMTAYFDAAHRPAPCSTAFNESSGARVSRSLHATRSSTLGVIPHKQQRHARR